MSNNGKWVNDTRKVQHEGKGGTTGQKNSRNKNCQSNMSFRGCGSKVFGDRREQQRLKIQLETAGRGGEEEKRKKQSFRHS